MLRRCHLPMRTAVTCASPGVFFCRRADSSAVFRLTTLGSPVLADAAGAEIRSVLAQPKRLAVLAYVATEGSQGFVRRETLLALFWPDSDAEAARQALRQTLYHLRRETGEDVFLARSTDEIAINRDVLWCDAVEFDQCASGRRYLEAMALYRGDFLPAFAFANQSAEFEQWLESTRARLPEQGSGSRRRSARRYRARRRPRCRISLGEGGGAAISRR